MAGTSDYADYTGQAQSQSSNSSNVNSNIEQLLRELNRTVSEFTEAASRMSQSAARDSASSRRSSDSEDTARHFRDSQNSGGFRGRSRYTSSRQASKSFEDILRDSLLGPDFQKNVDKILNNVGQQLGKSVSERLKSTAFGQSLGNFSDVLGKVAASGEINAASIAELGSAAMGVVPGLLAVTAAVWVADKALESLKPAIDGIKGYFAEWKKVANRNLESQRKYTEEEQKRIAEDVRTLVEAPFKILEEAVSSVTATWDNNLRLITATQELDKAGLQSLMAAYSQRLYSDENRDWSSVINASDITANLAKVLEAGLSGEVATEFAYIATKLNAAIPTQDFFSYASVYSSIAANAIKNGAAQSEALKTANKAIEDFANNLLYASRELAGGFSTGLTNAANIFEMATKISQASRTGDIGNISGVLTAAQAIIGATAPDLASSITDAIYKAATGGNSSTIVALRSLAGINASNTEFLRALAKDPQQVFTNMFKKLADMYNQSADAYMEKAEGYASLFGLSPEAFQRIDFNYLASAIENMNIASGELASNLDRLESGQTTLTQEQLKNQQINKYLVDEGLAYVLDNEAARAIQQHMWDEQLAQQMIEASYGVELQGASQRALEGLLETLQRIVDILNPVAWYRKFKLRESTKEELEGMKIDLMRVLEAGKVGSGSSSSARNSLYQLTTYGQMLPGVYTSLVELMGQQSAYAEARAATSKLQQFTGDFVSGGLLATGQGTTITSTGSSHQSGKFGESTSVPDTSSLSQSNVFLNPYQPTYQGDTVPYGSSHRNGKFAPVNTRQYRPVGKSQAAESMSYLEMYGESIANSSADMANAAVSTTAKITEDFTQRIQHMLSDEYLVDQFIRQNKSYEEWAASSASFGIVDFASAAQSAGYNVDELQRYFQSREVDLGLSEQASIYEDEKDFRDKGRLFWEETFPVGYQQPLFDILNAGNDLISDLIAQEAEFIDTWNTFTDDWSAAVKSFSDYFIVHKVYNAAYSYDDVRKIQQQEESEKGDAVLALAEALTQNTVDLKDPAVQTNALLSQILIVIEAIMQQNNTAAGTVSLADTLSALSMGMTNRTV